MRCPVSGEGKTLSQEAQGLGFPCMSAEGSPTAAGRPGLPGWDAGEHGCSRSGLVCGAGGGKGSLPSGDLRKARWGSESKALGPVGRDGDSEETGMAPRHASTDGATTRTGRPVVAPEQQELASGGQRAGKVPALPRRRRTFRSEKARDEGSRGSSDHGETTGRVAPASLLEKLPPSSRQAVMASACGPSLL